MLVAQIPKMLMSSLQLIVRVAALAAAGVGSGGPRAQGDRPNVIWVLVDDCMPPFPF